MLVEQQRPRLPQGNTEERKWQKTSEYPRLQSYEVCADRSIVLALGLSFLKLRTRSESFLANYFPKHKVKQDDVGSFNLERFRCPWLFAQEVCFGHGKMPLAEYTL